MIGHGLACPKPRTGVLLAAALAAAFQTGSAAAQDCQIQYAWASSPGSQQLELVSMSRGQTKAINRSDMLWVSNKKDRKIEVQVTIPTGGSKWVALERDRRDPPALNYIGNVTLQNAKCLHLHESPVAMFSSVWDGDRYTQFATVQQVKQEFNLSATELLTHLQPHVTPQTMGRALRELFSYSPAQLVSTFKQRGYSVAAARDALGAATTEEERRQVVDFPLDSEGAVLIWLITAYDRIESARSIEDWSARGLAAPPDAGHLVDLMKRAQFTPVEAARTLRARSSGGARGPAEVAAILYRPSYTINNVSYTFAEVAQGLRGEFNVSPLQIAQWLLAAEGTHYDFVADALAGLDPNPAQVTAWLLQTGAPPVDIAMGMGRRNPPTTVSQVAAGFRLAGMDASIALTTLQRIRSMSFAPFAGQMQNELQMATILREAGFPARPAALALVATYNVSANVVDSHRLPSWLMAAGYSPRDVVDGTREAFPGDGESIADRLRHPNAQGFVNTMSGMGGLTIRPEQAVEGLKASFGASNAQVAAWLDSPWTPLEQALGIFSRLTKSGTDVAAWMKPLRTPQQIGGALKVIVTDDRDRIANFFRTANFTAADAANGIRYIGMFDPNYDISNNPEVVAKAMAGGGFTFDQVLAGITAHFPSVTRNQLIEWLCGTNTRNTTSSKTLTTTTKCAVK